MSVTHTEWSVADFPTSVVSGTGKRRKFVFFRGTNTAVSDTIDVSGTAEPNSADIEGIISTSIESAGTGHPSWSTNVITLDQGIGAHEMVVVVNIT
jgi:hypothetical protein